MKLKFCVFGCLLVSASFSTSARTYLDYPVNEKLRFNYYLRLAGQVPGAQTQDLDLRSVVLHRESLKSAQAVQQTKLITDLSLLKPKDQPSTLLSALQAAEVTGRLPVFEHDTDVLRYKPDTNPLLQIGDQVSLSQPSNQVLVLSSDQHCSVPYEPGQFGKAYVKACLGQPSLLDVFDHVDKGWLVQPNGEVHKLNMGFWNLSPQPTPMPGSFVIARKRGGDLDPELFERVALFLATQGSSIELAQRLGIAAPQNSNLYTLGELEPAPRFMPRDNNDFGQVGIFQTPTARMHEAGTLGVTFSKVDFYNRTSFSFQPLDWFEGTLRYTKVLNTNIAAGVTDEKFLDKGFDAKVRLIKESAFVPEISLGLVDVGGTGLFSGEYLVGSKRVNNFDFSVGLGWGYFGRSADYNNPLSSVLGDQYDIRNNRDVGVGGEIELDQFFKGPASLFGGVQWHTPVDGLVLKAEYEGNNYQTDFGGPYAQSSRFNFGLTYHFTDNVSLSISQQRGEVLGFKLSLTPNLANERTPNVLDPAPVEPKTGDRPANLPNWEATVAKIEEQSKWTVTNVEEAGTEIRLTVAGSQAAYESEAIEKASVVLNNELPEKYKWFNIDYSLSGVDQAEVVVDRTAFENRVNNLTQANYTISDTRAERYTNTPTLGNNPRPEQAALAPGRMVNAANSRNFYSAEKDRFNGDFSLAYQQVFGGLDGILFQFYLAYTAQLNLSESTYITGRLGYRLFDNYDKFDEESQSALPPVRTKQKDYLTTEEGTIRNLSLVHVGQLGNSPHHYAAYGGYLEEMFGGIGAEYLYRPYGSPIAFGLDLNRVRQRDFDQRFSFQDYSVTTGHFTTYWDTGFQDLIGKVSVGQYLAGDFGATFDLSRQFNNGTVMGAFFTKTDVSAEQFGEGSFDKGIYLKVPWEMFMPTTIAGNVNVLYRPLTRDGGAMLNRPISLYGLTQTKNSRFFNTRPSLNTK